MTPIRPLRPVETASLIFQKFIYKTAQRQWWLLRCTCKVMDRHSFTRPHSDSGGCTYVRTCCTCKLGHDPPCISFTRPHSDSGGCTYVHVATCKLGHDPPCICAHCAVALALAQQVATTTMASLSVGPVQKMRRRKCMHLSSMESKLLSFSEMSWTKFLSCASGWKK